MKNSTEFTSNSLAIVSKILTLLENLDIHRKLLDVGSDSNEFPAWMHPGDRRLLQETVLWIRLVIHAHTNSTSCPCGCTPSIRDGTGLGRGE
uniref:Uncharacterized protein n=1 Tax=Nelumbo nucifera TaxID=4432 RepID=A0A822YVQ5_NELNU|nr:TPA_asm: hypothetical protein HUJ06_006843 [Nelumbo nucifera]